MQERLAARDRNHRGAAFVHGLETLLRRKLSLEDVSRILDLAATGTGEVAAEQRLKHKDEWILFASGDLLPEHITSHRPHLRNGNTHCLVDLLSMLSGAASPKPKPLTAEIAKNFDATTGVNGVVYRPDSGVEKRSILW